VNRRVIAILAVALGLIAIGAGVFWFRVVRQTTQHVSPVVVDARISDCGVEPLTSRPDQITATCADAGIVATKIDWRYWGPTMASGTGIVSANDCAPSCAEGSRIDYPTTVVLDRVQVREAGPEFTRMTLIYTDHAPGENPVDQFDLTPL
jgi:hypothetical protein